MQFPNSLKFAREPRKIFFLLNLFLVESNRDGFGRADENFFVDRLKFAVKSVSRAQRKINDPLRVPGIGFLKIDDDGNVIYTGTKQDGLYRRQFEIADGVYETVNTTGDRVFGWYEGDGEGEYSGIMGALKLLSNSIQDVIDGHANGDETLVQSGYDKMNSTLDMFKDSLATITAEQAKFGGISNRLDMTSNTLETNTENLTSYLSQLQEVDIAQAVSDWYQAQYAYQASMQVAAASMNMSLLNYIQ